jgi:hypothetical protein
MLIFVFVGVYPSFTIDTDSFELGPHTLALVLRVGTSILRVSIYELLYEMFGVHHLMLFFCAQLVPDLVFEGTAPPSKFCSMHSVSVAPLPSTIIYFVRLILMNSCGYTF